MDTLETLVLSPAKNGSEIANSAAESSDLEGEVGVKGHGDDGGAPQDLEDLDVDDLGGEGHEGMSEWNKSDRCSGRRSCYFFPVHSIAIPHEIEM